MCDVWWLLGWQSETAAEVLDRLKMSLRTEWRKLDREARKLDTEAKKVPEMIRKELRAGNRDGARTFAVEMSRMYRVRSSLLVCQNRINEAKTAITTCKTNLAMGRAMIDMTRVLQGLANLDETRDLCKMLSREMLKAGIIQQEMMDALEPDLDPEQQEEADEIIEAAEGDAVLERTEAISAKKSKKASEDNEIQMEADRLLLMEAEFIKTGKRTTLPVVAQQTEAAPEAADD